ncbi:MAG: bacterioferritin [Acidobacteriota bacterium]
MKGNLDVIAALNDRLSEELTSISMYMVHSEMCANWGFEKLHEEIEKQAMDEMKHAELLIGRILFLEGSPTVSRLGQMKIGTTVEEMIATDENAEVDAVKGYNDTIALAVKVGDNGTREMLAKILIDEERHVDWGETQRELIKQMGLQNYLANQA